MPYGNQTTVVLIVVPLPFGHLSEKLRLGDCFSGMLYYYISYACIDYYVSLVDHDVFYLFGVLVYCVSELDNFD